MLFASLDPEVSFEAYLSDIEERMSFIDFSTFTRDSKWIESITFRQIGCFMSTIILEGLSHPLCPQRPQFCD